MPVKLWRRENGVLSSSVETHRQDNLGGEHFRHEADSLDLQIDAMLDCAVGLSNNADTGDPKQLLLVRRWAFGRALHESRILESDDLDSQERDLLWLALARKCRLGVRADGSSEDRWRSLIPARSEDPKRISRDVLVIGLWLQEQTPVESVVATFAGRFENAGKFYLRSSLRPLVMRHTVAKWMGSRSPSELKALSNTGNYLRVINALSARFPGRGPGSAKRPVHFSPDELYREVCETLSAIGL